MFEKADLFKENINPFQEIGNGWTLITARNNGKVNTMTASWGGMGILWNKPVVTVYIRQTRYTKEFVDGQEYFTLSLFDGHKKELGVLGTKSGRDGDKIAEVGFHVTDVDGQPTFDESKAVFVCRKLYEADMPLKDIPEDIVKRCYPDMDYHTMYIGEIVGMYVNK